MIKKKILVVDDEKDLCEILQFNLENEGYEITVAHSAEEALEIDLIETFDLILLDVMMGKMSGYKMASILKKNPEHAHIPIIFLTARDSENDTLTGFSIGADDYLSKPFSIRELIARVNVVLRRGEQKNEAATAVIVFEEMVLKIEKKELRIAKETITLTKTEFEIIHLFLSNKNRIFSRDEIMYKAWPNNTFVSDRTIDVNITRLRKKIGIYSKHIITRHGYGYGFED